MSLHTRWLTIFSLVGIGAGAVAHPPMGERVTRLATTRTQTALDVPLLLELSEMQRRAGRPERALELTDEAAGWAPDDAAVIAERGESLFMLGRDAEAERHLALALALRPDAPSWRLTHARVLARQSRHLEALNEFEQLGALADVDAWLEHGRLLRAMHRHREAARVFEQGAVANSGSGVLWREAVLAHARGGDCVRALALAQDQERRTPVPIAWRLVQLDLLTALGRTRDAHQLQRGIQTDLDRARHRRDSPMLHAWQAELWLRTGQLARAHSLLASLPGELAVVQQARERAAGRGEVWTCID